MSKRLFSIIALVMLLTVPVMASPLSSVLEWISAQTGLTDQVVGWIGTFIVLPVLGWITKNIDWQKAERLVYTKVYDFAQALNDKILTVKGLGYAWENWIEPFVIKAVAGLFRVIGQIPLAFVAGLNSRGESLVKK